MDHKKKEIRLIKLVQESVPSNPVRIIIKHVDFAVTAVTGIGRRKLADYLNLEEDRDDMAFDDLFGHDILNYIALSYTWGPELLGFEILVSSGSHSGWFTVRKNLHDFLILRRQSTSPAFWIDQICINQGDNDEKSHQVNQMAEIYMSATIVEVWLGNASDDVEEAVDLIACEGQYRVDNMQEIQGREYFRKAFLLAWRQTPGTASNPGTSIPYCPSSSRPSKIKEAVLPKLQARADSLESICDLPYWSRLWIVQEVILGRDVCSRFRNKVVPWRMFREGLEGFITFFAHIAPGTDVGEKLLALYRRIVLIDGFGGEAQRASWSLVASRVQDTLCTDMRDRAFGAMGMLTPELRFFPDYSMGPLEILHQLLTKDAKALFDEEHFVDRNIIIDTAAEWVSILDVNRNDIDRKSVRRHIFELLRQHPRNTGAPFKRTWKLNLQMWYYIPNKRSWIWRFANSEKFRDAFSELTRGGLRYENSSTSSSETLDRFT